MKNLFIIFLSVLCLCSCSDKYESLYHNAPPPTIIFSKDTLFVREKDPTNINTTNSGIVMISCSPVGHQFNLAYSEASGKLHFTYRGQPLIDSKPFVVTDEMNLLYCYADSPGIYPVDFYLTDQLGRTATRTLWVKCMQGQKPIAALNWEMISDSNDNWIYSFNAGGSRQPFGSIMSYHYLINNRAIVVTHPMLKYIFHDKGQQPISFFVVDDLGNSSDTLNYLIDIP